MPVFDTTTIQKFANDGECAFACDSPCIIDRVSLNIVSGTPIYELPSYVTNIRRITYMGWKLFPMPHRDLRQSYLAGLQQGRPFWYIFNGIATGNGTYNIKLFPVPQENISVESIYSKLWGESISTKFIVEFYRTPDSTTTQYLIPRFLRRRLLKCYVNARCNAIEGKSSNSKSAKYWNDKWNYLKEIYGNTLEDLISKPRKIIANNESASPFGIIPPSPVLPVSRYGISVDDITG